MSSCCINDCLVVCESYALHLDLLCTCLQDCLSVLCATAAELHAHMLLSVWPCGCHLCKQTLYVSVSAFASLEFLMLLFPIKKKKKNSNWMRRASVNWKSFFSILVKSFGLIRRLNSLTAWLWCVSDTVAWVTEWVTIMPWPLGQVCVMLRGSFRWPDLIPPSFSVFTIQWLVHSQLLSDPFAANIPLGDLWVLTQSHNGKQSGVLNGETKTRRGTDRKPGGQAIEEMLWFLITDWGSGAETHWTVWYTSKTL